MPYKSRAMRTFAQDAAQTQQVQQDSLQVLRDAFTEMQNVTENNTVSEFFGGAFAKSEYENNMPPNDQSRYEQKILESFQRAYMQDPYKGTLDFDHWLKSVNPTLIEERAIDHEAKRERNAPLEEVNPLEATSYTIQSLAHLHTGRVEDLIRIVETLESSTGFNQSGAYQEMNPQGDPGFQPSTGPFQANDAGFNRGGDTTKRDSWIGTDLFNQAPNVEY